MIKNRLMLYDKDMVKLLPLGLVVLLMVGSLIYLRVRSSENLSLPSSNVITEDTAEYERRLAEATNEERVKILESSVIKLAKEVSTLKSSQNLTELEQRLQKLEQEVAGLTKETVEIDFNPYKSLNLTPTAAPTATPVSKSVFYIPLSGNTDGSSHDYSSVESVEVLLDPADFPGYSGMQLEVNIKMSEDVGTAYARLYNQTDGSAISSSEISTTAEKYTLLTSSSFKLPSGRKTYRLQIKSTNGYNIYLQNARLKVSF